MEKVKKKKVQKPYCTDRLATNLWRTMLRDFRTVLGPDFAARAEESFTSIKSFREYEFPVLGDIDPWRFKAYGQLKDLLKKYRYASDAYSDEELAERTTSSYLEAQLEFCVPKTVTLRAHRVYQEARRLARQILGQFPTEEVTSQMQFGRNSSIGCPFALAYLDYKLTEIKAMTGTEKSSRWFFEDYLPGDPLLSRIVAKTGVTQDTIENFESLSLISVPKSWKINRAITPLTLVSLFYSYGYGNVVTDRLAENGLDIRRLQGIHRKLVRIYSLSLKGATVDLKRASDSILCEHLNRVLPRDWYVALKKTLTHQIVISDGVTDKQYYTASVLPMGNGATFPVETLVFYCIIKAVGNLLNVQGVYSVYGDDLIYPSKIHGVMSQIFKDIGFTINSDKSFVRSPFRESCGADYYRGCDVRPFMLPGQASKMTRSQYATFLYKVINGLQRRWTHEELPECFRFLFIELGLLGMPILRVPPNYPDTAGVKVPSPDFVVPALPLLEWSPIKVYFDKGSRWFSFKYWTQTSRKRYLLSVEPYYWLSLSGKLDTQSSDPKYDYKHQKDVNIGESLIGWQRYKRHRSWFNKDSRKHVKKEIVSFKPWIGSKTEFVHTIKNTEPETISDWF